MNKNIKKMLVFLGCLVAAIIIIAVIYLLATQTVGNNGETPSPSASVSATASPSPSETAEPTISTPIPTDEGSVTTEETADGTKYNITVPGANVSYSIVADSTIFEYLREDGSDTFMDVSEAGEYLSIMFIEDSKAAQLAPSFLDQFINYNEFEQSGEEFIPGTEKAGEKVMANDGNTQFEAWLVDTDTGVLAVVISYNLADKEAQMTKLNQILGSLTIIQ